MKMKKVGALVLAGALLTMGGVYAQWSFSEEATSGTSTTISIGIDLSTAEGKKGTYGITKPQDVKYFAVCQLGSAFVEDWYTTGGLTVPEGDTHQAVLLPNRQAELVLTFTPNANADKATRTEGVKTSWTYSLVHPTDAYTIDTATNKYMQGGAPTNILELTAPDAEDSAKQTITILPYTDTPEDGKHYWERTDNGDGTYTFTYTISAVHIAEDHVKLAKDFIVDTKAAYDEFEQRVIYSYLKLTIAEIVETA